MYPLICKRITAQNRPAVLIKCTLRQCRSYNIVGNQQRKCQSSNAITRTVHSDVFSNSMKQTSKRSVTSYCDIFSRNHFPTSDCSFYPIYVNNSIQNGRLIHSSALLLVDKPSSKIEETVTALKEKAKSQENGESKPNDAVVVKKSLKQKIVDELVHYYHGFRLLFIDISVSVKLVGRILAGKQLSRRERNLLVRTTSDLFRLLPFSVFIIVPFMELLLPVFIKLFPGMLPTTFETASEKDKKMKQSLKVKLEMAKFLQETLDNMTLKGSGHSSQAAKDFAEFFEKVRSEGGFCTNEEVMKFSKLFEDEITLDSLPRPQLMALCRVLELKPIGTSNFLRFQLRMKLRSLAADDVMIEKEGIDTLTLSELQQACRVRGMRAYGLSMDRLKYQLSQWLELSLHKKVPPSLLLLSRAFMLPETIPTTDKLKATISALPETVAVSTKAAIGEREGKVDNKTKIEIIKEEQRKIQEERKEVLEEKRQAKEKLEEGKLRREAELLVDKASELVDNAIDLEPKVLFDKAQHAIKSIDHIRKKLEDQEVSSEDIQTLQDAMEILASEKKSLLLEKEELQDLKEELAEYKEDVEDLQEVIKTSEAADTKIKESKAAKRLFKKVNSMIEKMDEVVTKLEKKEKDIKNTLSQEEKAQDNDELMRIDELIGAIRKIQKIPDESTLEKIAAVLGKIDEDRDGSIRVDTVLKVLEEIDEQNVQLSSAQIQELVDLLEKEAAIEVEEQVEKALEKEYSNATSPTSNIDDKKSLNGKLIMTEIAQVEKTVPPNEEVKKPKSKVL